MVVTRIILYDVVSYTLSYNLSYVTVLVKIVQFDPDQMEPCKPGEPDLQNGSGGRWQQSARRAGTRERRRGGGGNFRRGVAGYSLRGCSYTP